MNSHFSAIDIQTIKALISTKTDLEISEIVEIPVASVREQINLIVGDDETRNYQLNHIEELRKKDQSRRMNGKRTKSLAQIEAEQSKEKSRLQREARIKAEDRRIKERDTREHRRMFTTKPVDLSQMLSVRIDNKTTVFVKPGTDIEKIKKQYTKNEA